MKNALMYCVRATPSTEGFCVVRMVILSARNSSGTFRRTKVRLSAKKARRKSRLQLTAGGGEGGGQEGYGTILVSLPSHNPRLRPKGYRPLTRCAEENVFFSKRHKRPVGRLARIPSKQVCIAAERRPAVAKYRDTARQAAAKTERHDPRMPRKGRLRPGLLKLHTVQRSWPRSRSQMLRIRGKQPQLRNDMTSH